MFPDLHHVQSFLVTFEESSMQKAAERLNIKQSTLRNHLRCISEFYGMPLFSKKGRGIQPTNDAERIYKTISPKLCSLQNELTNLKHFDAKTTKRTFNIACPEYYALPLVQFFHNESSPELTCCIYEQISEGEKSIRDVLKSKRLDCVISPRPSTDPSLNSMELERIQVALAANINHPILKKKTVSQNEYLSLKHATLNKSKMHIREFSQTPIPSRQTQFVGDSLLSIIAIISKTDLVAVLPTKLIDQYSNIFPIGHTKLEFRYQPISNYLIWDRAGETPDIKWLIERINTVSKI
ncbi:LysR family transcriptional regulator [Vibrio sp. SCSIO 43135]|uniref:LysR family transcriptional regulator n=1 Tax=Vibrio sp. SCSIO 43135 TaxID=2819096 RepID=UPI00218854C4|nr:LysR family transcriptional regulator [Vibrio sp. SCSIO 43135]USD42360.1 LysR family transcriptional regulator [Vibrio sp. SCSIO 43135]